MREGFHHVEQEPPVPPNKPEIPAADAASTPVARTDQEIAKEAIDAYFESFLELHAERTNEGNNGIIMKLDIKDMADDIREAFKTAGWDLGTDQVAKVLKVYSRGKGKKEFDLQKKAHEIIAGQGGGEAFAVVPTPRYYTDIPLTAELKDKFKRTSDGFVAGGRIEILLMDEVKGADIATKLYREVVRRHPMSVHLVKDVDTLSIEALIDEVTRVLDFKEPGGKARTAALRAQEDEKVKNENMELMFTWLEKANFQVDPRIPEAITATMNAFHANGLAFRDAHPRNFMIEGGIEAGEGAPPRTFVIDFGNATTFEGPFNEMKEKLFVDDVSDRRFPADDLTVNMLKPLTTPPEERMGAEKREYLEELLKLNKRIEANANPKLKTFVERLPAMIETGANDKNLAHADVAASPAASNVDYLLAPLADAISKGRIGAETARAFLLNLQPRLKTVDQNKVARFLSLRAEPPSIEKRATE